MIDSKEKLKECLRIERKIYYPNNEMRFPFDVREKDVLFRYIKLMRMNEYYYNTNHKILAFIYEAQFKRISNKYCIHIGINTCEPGLSIAHVGPVIIHGDSHIGKNLRVNVGVNIGANGGKPPTIGDNVYIGPGAKIFGDIFIANNCRIGANAVVNKSCGDIGSTLVGVPARAIEAKRDLSV